jgi:threonine/homoserine/homoserine lactone efflux protein
VIGYNHGVIPVWGFVAVALPLVLTPGVSTAIVLRNSLTGGTRAGVETAVGANAGSFCYGLLSAFGVALALQRWPGVWGVLRWLGVGYLGWLGLQSLHRAFRPPDRTAGGAGATLPKRRARSVDTSLRNLRDGFVTNVLNPALATFYLVILPQFVPRSAPVVRSVMLLTAIHISLAASWHVAWAAAGGTLARTIATGRPRQALELLAGIALIALAIKLAVVA